MILQGWRFNALEGGLEHAELDCLDIWTTSSTYLGGSHLGVQLQTNA